MAGRIEVIAAVASTLDLCRAPEHFVHVSRRVALETREESRAALVAPDNFFTTKPEAESRHSAISELNFPDVPSKRCVGQAMHININRRTYNHRENYWFVGTP
jgi:hypothetical protein